MKGRTWQKNRRFIQKFFRMNLRFSIHYSHIRGTGILSRKISICVIFLLIQLFISDPVPNLVIPKEVSKNIPLIHHFLCRKKAVFPDFQKIFRPLLFIQAEKMLLQFLFRKFFFSSSCMNYPAQSDQQPAVCSSTFSSPRMAADTCF